MPRSQIPWEKLQKAADLLFPKPVYRKIRVIKPHYGFRTNHIKAPRTIYHRNNGKYERIGYRVLVQGWRLMGISNDLDLEWKPFQKYVLICID
jgi:hypothetical protein